MSNTAVTDTPIDVMDRLSTATFEELAGAVTEAMEMATAHANATIDQLIKAGGALREMRDRMPGQYGRWLAEAGINARWARSCQRLHAYSHQLPAEAFLPTVASDGRTVPPSLARSLALISNLPLLPRGVPAGSSPSTATEAIKKLRAAGATDSEVARALGIGRDSVRKATMTRTQLAELAKRKNELRNARKAAASALRRQAERAERDALARTSGKELSVAYGAIRQALAAIDRANLSTTDIGAISNANRYLSAAESAIVVAMRAERASQ